MMLLPSPSCHPALSTQYEPALHISKMLHHIFAAPQSVQETAEAGQKHN